MRLDPATCYRALVARDPRFDGTFFVGVKTTGIYCRPICTARTPRRDRCVFYERAALAERDGFRACFTCRPELAPGHAPVDSVSRLVARAIARIEEGALDGGSVEALAAELGVSARHLRRAFAAEVGVPPRSLALSRRMALAKQLVTDGGLSMAQIAFASGFRSVRRFNAAFRARFGRAPSELGRAARGGDSIALRLDYRPPLDWEATLAFLAARAIPPAEVAAAGAYRRTVRIGAASGWIVVAPDPARAAVIAEVSTSLAPELVRLVAGLRRMLDLDAHPEAIRAHLARDARLAPLVTARPGVRIPGALDPFEVLVRAVLGQQVSVRAAATLARRLLERFGAPVATPPWAELSRAFPSAEELARVPESELAAIGLPAARARTLALAARAVARGDVRLDATDPSGTIAALVTLPGVGRWTAEYVAMRGLAWPDALPSGDLVLRRAMAAGSARELEERAERWRPWRAYAAMHLWTERKEGLE